jgi:conjugal transfer pilus assembly protein TraL
MSNQDQDLSHYIPRHLDNSGKFLWWDLDVAGVGMLGMLVGMGTGHVLLGVILGIGLAYGYGRIKAGKHPGVAAHLMYWWFGQPQTKDLPPSHLRELNG